MKNKKPDVEECKHVDAYGLAVFEIFGDLMLILRCDECGTDIAVRGDYLWNKP